MVQSRGTENYIQLENF